MDKCVGIFAVLSENVQFLRGNCCNQKYNFLWILIMVLYLPCGQFLAGINVSLGHRNKIVRDEPVALRLTLRLSFVSQFVIHTGFSMVNTNLIM